MIPFFPSVQFHVEGYATSYRLDRNANGGGTLLYLRGNIPLKLLFSDRSIGFVTEIKLKNEMAPLLLL